MTVSNIYWISVLEDLSPLLTFSAFAAWFITLTLAIIYGLVLSGEVKFPLSFKWIVLAISISSSMTLANLFIPSSQTYAAMLLTSYKEQGKTIDKEHMDTLKPMLDSWVRSITHDYPFLYKKDKDKSE